MRGDLPSGTTTVPGTDVIGILGRPYSDRRF